MKKKLSRFTAMLLAVVMAVGLIPLAWASEIPNGISAPEAAETTASAETLQTGTEDAAESSVQDILDRYVDVSAVPEPFVENAVTPYASANCQAAQLAAWWVNTVEQNPSGGWDDYIYYEFPKGEYRKSSIIGLHTVKIDGAWRTAYCIEPGIKAGDYYETQNMTMDEWLQSQYQSGHLTEAQMRAIGVVLLYGQISRPTRDDLTGLARMLSTQILVWEIALGDRSPYPPYTRYADTYIRRFADGDYGAEVTSYFLDIPQGTRVRGIIEEYDKIAARLEAHYRIPSFASLRQSQAPIIDLKPNGDGTYSASVQDNTGVLDQFTFQNTGNLSFSKSGNTLNITASDDVADTLVSATKSVPSAKGQVYYVMNSGSYQKMLASVSEPQNDPLPAYFRVRTPSGKITIQKATEDGSNLGGWKFGIYADQGCSSLISGPHISGSNGLIEVGNLKSGTYWVKEIGHTNSSIDSKYFCAGTNPQKVTVSSGQTASVSFTNSLRRGVLCVKKTTNTGGELEGWKIGVFYDADCRRPIPGSPFVTGRQGEITVPDLLPGTYYAQEIDESELYPYWAYDTEVKKAVIAPDQTATVKFHNTELGDLRIKKNAVNGSAEGWNFEILNSGREVVETIRTGADGYAYSGKLTPGQYYIREIQDRDDTYWTYDAEVEKQVMIEAGKQAEVVYTNTQYGRIKFQKTTNTHNHLKGWIFEVRNSVDELVGRYETDETGYADTGKLEPGRYYVKEVNSDDPYWSCDVRTSTVEVTAGKTVGISCTNVELGKGTFHKFTNTGKDLQGWEITVYRDPRCENVAGTVVTGENGVAGIYLEPGFYYAKETGDRNNRFDDPFWKMDTAVRRFEIKAHENTPLMFLNTHYGKIRVIKTMTTDGPLEGWRVRITDVNGNEVKGSPFTTDAEGLIQTGNLNPGTYIVEEIIPADSPYYCQSENPQQIEVIPGTTAEVRFQNALQTGRIAVHKENPDGEPLEGAKFLLEWSEDGLMWAPIVYSDQPDVVKGTCSDSAVKDGCLVTGADGLAQWNHLHPGIYYRLTEIEAPQGYTLLTETAFEGRLPTGEPTVALRVVNSRSYELPKTGSEGLLLLPVKLGICAACFAGAAGSLRKKEDDDQ